VIEDLAANGAFDSFVEDDDDLVGLLAYSLYKQHKRDWVIAFKDGNGGRRPDPTVYREYERSMLTGRMISRLRQNAESALIGYASSYTELQVPEIEKNALSREILKAAATVKASSNWGRQITQSFVVSILVTAFLTLLVLSVSLFGIDLVDGFESLSP